MGNPRWRKVFADILENKMRSFVVIASITIGVFAIGLLGTLFQLIYQESHETFESVNPANITIQMMDFGDNFLESATSVNGISDIEGRRILNLTMINAQGETEPFQITALKDFATTSISSPKLEKGLNHIKEGEIVVAKKFLDEQGLAIGDKLSIKLTNGHIKNLQIIGSIEDWTLEIDQIFFNKGVGFINMNSLSYLAQPFAYNTLVATVSTDPYEKEAISIIANSLEEKIEDTGRIIFTTKLTEKDVPPLNSIIVSLLLMVSFLGILIMLLSAFLIANTMNSVLLQQARQIGVMKLIGAKRKQIIQMYLVLSMIYGFISMIIAIPTGLLGGRFISEMVCDLINCELTNVSVIPNLPYVILTQILVAVFIPILASLLPVLKGTKTTVRKALSGNFGMVHVDDGKFTRWVESFSWMSGLTVISVRNTFRRKGRLVTTLFALALGGAIFISVFNTQGSLDRQLAINAEMMGVDVNIQFSKAYSLRKVEEALISNPEVAFVEGWGSAFASYTMGLQEENVFLIAPQKQSKTIKPTLVSGRWFIPDDQRAIVVNQNFLDMIPDFEIGDEILLDLSGKEKNWTVIGSYHNNGSQNFEAYVQYETLMQETSTHNKAYSFRIILHNQSLENQQKMAKELMDWLNQSGYDVFDANSVKVLAKEAGEMTNILVLVMLILAILTAIVGSIGMTGTLGMNIIERTSEFGILRAIGANNQVITKLVIVEGLLIGALSYIFSIMMSFPITVVLKTVVIKAIFGTSGTYVIAWQGFAIWAGLILIFSIFASVVPARNASQLTIREVLAYE